MNILDFVLIALFAWSLYQGVTQGLLRSFTRFVAIFIGTWIATPLAAAISNRVTEPGSSPVIPFVIFIITLGLVTGGLNFVATLLDKVFKVAQLSWVMRIGGAAFGILKIGLLASVALLYAEQSGTIGDINSSSFTRDSKLYPKLVWLAERCTPAVELIQEEHGAIREQVEEVTEEVIERAEEEIDRRAD